MDSNLKKVDHGLITKALGALSTTVKRNETETERWISIKVSPAVTQQKFDDALATFPTGIVSNVEVVSAGTEWKVFLHAGTSGTSGTSGKSGA